MRSISRYAAWIPGDAHLRNVGVAQVAKALILVIPLASLVGFAEEFTFRGYLPLILAVKTGMPAVAIVGVSGVIFGVRRWKGVLC